MALSKQQSSLKGISAVNPAPTLGFLYGAAMTSSGQRLGKLFFIHKVCRSSNLEHLPSCITNKF